MQSVVCVFFFSAKIGTGLFHLYNLTKHMGQVIELRLSCYLVLLSIDSKTR